MIIQKMRRQRNLIHIARRWFAAPNRKGRESRNVTDARKEIATPSNTFNFGDIF